MFDRSSSRESVSAFEGPVLLLDAADVSPARGLLARNIDYLDGQAKTRFGFTNAYNVNEAVTGLCNWQGAPPGNTLVWFRSSDLTIRRGLISSLSNNALSGALTGAYSAIFAPAATRMYASAFTTANRGVSGGNRVFSYQSAAFTNDSAFLGPVTFGGSGITETAAGEITAGTHNFGFAIEYRTGFRTRLSPDNSGSGDVKLTTFVPYQFTATGGQNIRWIITPTTWPAAAVKVHVAMTTVSNRAEYFFVPDANVAVTGGGSGTATITFDISDQDLVAYGEPATDHLFMLTQNTNGVDRIATYHVSFYGDRGVWLSTQPDSVGNQRCVAFYSNPGRYEQITLDQNMVTLPGGRDINCHFALGQVSYLLGPTWTYQTVDTGAVPAEWPTPQLVDGRRGTLSIRGVEVAPTGEYAWVADQTGLYLFKGQYDDLPVSYWQTPDWNRINWNYGHTVQIKDIPSERKVVVLAPLDGATSPSHMLTWNYESGKRYDKIRYSLNHFINYNPGAIEMVQNTLSGVSAELSQKSQLWVAPSDANQMIRAIALSSETNPYQDQALPVHSLYETGLFPNGAYGPLYRHQGETARLKGAGPLQMNVYSIDRTILQCLQSIEVTSAPGEEYTRLCDLVSEGASVRIDANVVPDGDFDGNTGIWTPAGGNNWSVTTGNARSGSYHAQKTSGGVGSSLENPRRINVTAGATLFGSFWLKGSGANGTVNLVIKVYSPSDVLLQTLTISSTGTPASYTFQSGTTAAVNASASYALVSLTATTHTTGTWYVDDVSLIQLGANFVWAEHTHYFKEWATRR